ncbi:MAG: hypothetical protein LBS86_05485 [Treponema sp.]|jgi:hypothetical protein|nr:hypothetical protein [Treponema sp.]
MNTLKHTLDERLRFDAELAEMDKHPIDCSDIPPMQDADVARLHFGYERFLSMLPPDIVKELARRRLEEINATEYGVMEPLEAAASALHRA